MAKTKLVLGLTQGELAKLGLTAQQLKEIAAARNVTEFGFVDEDTRLPSGEVTSFPLLVDLTHGGSVTYEQHSMQTKLEKLQGRRTARVVRSKRGRE